MNMKDEKVNVPLYWYEIDLIIVALRLINRMHSGDYHSELEQKLDRYSHIAKEVKLKEMEE